MVFSLHIQHVYRCEAAQQRIPSITGDVAWSSHWAAAWEAVTVKQAELIYF